MRELTAEQFISDVAERIERDTHRQDRLMTNNSVTLRKRFRNQSDADRYGVISPVNNEWTADWDMSVLKSFNIVTPTIRTNAAVMSTSNVVVDIEPRFIQDTRSQMAAKVAHAIYSDAADKDWTSSFEMQVATEQQLGMGVFIRQRHIMPLDAPVSIKPLFAEKIIESSGEATCSQCGESVPVGSADILVDAAEQAAQEMTDAPQPEYGGAVGSEIPEGANAAEPQMPSIFNPKMATCPQCGGQALVEKEPGSETIMVAAGIEAIKRGRIETTICPFFEFRVDPVGTNSGDLSRARWFEHHYLKSVDELEIAYPSACDAIRGAGHEFSYPLEWSLSLARGNEGRFDGDSSFSDDLREVRDIYLTPEMYLNVKLTEDFELREDGTNDESGRDGDDAGGRVKFSVKAGETFADAVYNGKPFDTPPTLCFRMLGRQGIGHILDVYPADFKKEFTYIQFFPDPSGFWGVNLGDLTTLQDMVNAMLTIQYYHIRRNSITSLAYNRAAFNPEDFGFDRIPTKDELPFEIPIGSQIAEIPALRLSGELTQMLDWMISRRSEVSLTTPAMMGQAQPYEPFKAQLLQKQSSLGLLAPASLSKAQAKVAWAKTRLCLAREHWTKDDTETLLRLNPEWTEDFITAFLDCDIERDLTIEFRAGTEIPMSLIEREMKINDIFSKLLAVMQAAPGSVKPEVLTQTLSMLTTGSDIDIDINDIGRDLRLAQSRLAKIQMLLPQDRFYTTGRNPQADAMVVAQILQYPDLTPQLWEGHDVQIDYYADRQSNESAREHPDMLLVQVLSGMIAQHEAAKTKLAQNMMMAQMEAQAPMMQAQAQAEQGAAAAKTEGQMALEQQKAAAKMDSERLRIAARADDKERGREHEREMRSVEAVAEAARAQEEREQAEAEARRNDKSGGRANGGRTVTMR